MPPDRRIDNDQASLVIQRQVGMALRLSFEAVTREPLPERMAILLLRLALAESVRRAVEEDQPNGDGLGAPDKPERLA